MKEWWQRRKGTGRRLLQAFFCLLVLVVGAMGVGSAVRAAEFQDAFAARELLSGDSGTLEGNTTSATREAGEPRHAGKPGGHSVWVAWEAPADGLLQLSTAGSAFDTILAAYRPEAGASATGFDGWESVGSNDDDDDERSEPTGLAGMSFPVRKGLRYAFVVDGYAGAAGNLRLDWKFTARSQALPIVGAVSGDRSARPGDDVTLSVSVDFAGSVEYRWFRNGEEVDDAESPTLTLRNFQRQDAGRYRLRIKVDDFVLYSEDVEVQLNSEGQDAVLARNKLFDALESRLRPETGRGAEASLGAGMVATSTGNRRLQSVAMAAAPIGVVRGLNGTQIFNTRFATRDPGEPLHCGQAGGASYWFAYENVTTGRLRFDTAESAVDAVLAVYTYDGVLTSYSQLQPVTCDLAQAPGHPAAVAEFPAEAGRTYLVAVDSRGGARGVIHLSYQWQPSSVEPVPPPGFVESPVSTAVQVGQPWQVSAVVTGAPPLELQWWKDGAPLVGATNAVWSVTSAKPAETGDYWLIATNAGGSATSAVARVEVTIPVPLPTILSGPASQRLAVGDSWQLSVEVNGAEPLSWQWWKDDRMLAEATLPNWGARSAVLDHAGLYWVVISNPGGSVTSAVARVEVVSPPVLVKAPASVTVAVGGRARLRVEAEPNPEPLTVTWWKDGQSIPGATGAECVLDSCTPETAGEYVAELTNFAGRIRSQPARVVVIATPQAMRLPGAAELLLCFPVAAGKSYQVELSSAATAGWVADEVLAADETGLLVYRHPMTGAETGFFRCVPVDAVAGSGK